MLFIFKKKNKSICFLRLFLIEQRSDRPNTYTDIYLAFQILPPQNDTYEFHTLSSNLISGYQIFSAASDTIYKQVLNNIDAKIQTTLIYKQTGNFSFERSLSNALGILNMASCTLKLLPPSLILDV